MKERKPKNVRPGAREAGVPARLRSKAAEAPRDLKVSAPVELQVSTKPAEAPAGGAVPASTASVTPPTTAARDAVGTAKPAPVAKPPAPAAKPAARSSADTPAKAPAAAPVTPPSAKAPAAPLKADSGAKSAPPASAQTAPAAPAAPASRPVEVGTPVQDVERAVRAVTAAAIETAQPTAAAVEAMSAASRSFAPVAAKAVEAGLEAMRRTPADLRNTGETTSRAMTDTASAGARGWVEFNAKMLDVMRAQSNAAFALWRDTVSARSFPDAVRAQTIGLQHLYETSSVQWKEVAEAVTRLMGDAAKPMGVAWPNRRL